MHQQENKIIKHSLSAYQRIVNVKYTGLYINKVLGDDSYRLLKVGTKRKNIKFSVSLQAEYHFFCDSFILNF